VTGENFRMNSFPQLAYDRLTNRLWVTWADDRNGQYANGVSVRSNGDVFLAQSTGGVHWSTPAKIGTGSDEFYPAVAALANQVAVSFYTRAYDPNGVGLDFAYVAGRGMNAADTTIRRITTQTSDPRSSSRSSARSPARSCRAVSSVTTPGWRSARTSVSIQPGRTSGQSRYQHAEPGRGHPVHPDRAVIH